MPRKLLILDIDETLVYSTDGGVLPRVDFSFGAFSSMKRPYLDQFISTVQEWFELAVWTSSSSGYAFPVLSHIFRDLSILKFVWCHGRCTQRFDPELREYFSLKNLQKVKRMGYVLESVLVVDDSPEKLARHYGNHIRVTPFEGDVSDTELRDLLPFLDSMRSVPNVRQVEKRDWREKSRRLRGFPK